MAIRKTKPTSPGRRFATYQVRAELTKSKPHKSLTRGKSSSGGRNSYGRVTSRHRGGGAEHIKGAGGVETVGIVARRHGVAQLARHLDSGMERNQHLTTA